MKEVLDKLDDKVDKHGEILAKMEVHVEEIKEDIKHHIKRTDLSEDRIFRLEKIEQFIRGALYVILGACALAMTILKMIDYYNKFN